MTIFITICTKDNKNLLWKNVGADIICPGINDFTCKLSEYGQIVKQAIDNIHLNYPMAEIEKYRKSYEKI